MGHLVPHSFTSGPRRVHHLECAGQRDLGRIAAHDKSARGLNSSGRDLHARPGDDAAVNRIAQVHVAVHCAQRLEIAQRGEADHQIFLRVGQRSQRTVLVRLAQDLVIKIWSIAENVSVGGDESGKHRRVTQVHNFGIWGYLYLLCRTNLRNAISFNQYHLVGCELFGTVEQPTGTDRNPVIRRGCRLSQN